MQSAKKNIQELVKCVGCPYGGARVGTRGNNQAPLAIIAEAPGSKEILEGMPLCGPSGKVFWSCVPGGEKRLTEQKDIYILNALQCFVRGKKKGQKQDPKLLQAVQCCRGRVHEQLKQAPRKLIVAMGNTAVWSITGDTTTAITKIRGKLIPSPHAEIGILPVVHPAALLRGTGSYRQFKMDLHYAFDLLEGKPPKKPMEHTYQVCETEEEVMAAVALLMHKPYVAADTETEGFKFRKHKILCVGLAGDPDHVFVIPGEERLLKLLKPLMESRKTRFIWHNGKFDIKFWWMLGIKARVDEDTMLLSYALDESGGIHDLEQVAGDLVGYKDWKHEIKQWVKKKTDSYALIPKPNLYKYQASDVAATMQIFMIMRGMVLSDKATNKLYTRTLIPLSEMLARVEWRGLLVNKEQLWKLGNRFVGNFDHYLQTGEIPAGEAGGEIGTLLKAFHDIAGWECNPNAPQQVAKLLYDQLKLPDKKGRSTDKKVLDKLPKHPAVQALRRVRTAYKAFSTYVMGVYNAIEDDGRVHTTYKIHGTRTGRLSSAEPNVQNVPRDPEIRSVYVAGSGRRFVEVDLNQAELRSLAALSGDEFMCKIYTTKGMSLHDEVRASIWGMPDKWTNKQRQEWIEQFQLPFDADDKRIMGEQKMRAKAVNFGIVYGRTAQSLAEEFSIPVEVAQGWIDAWFKRFPKAKEFIEKCRKAPLSAATLVTTFGRKKRHWLVTQEMLQGMQNEAANFPHQSIASDTNCDGAMTVSGVHEYMETEGRQKLEKYLPDYDAYIVNLVHDSLLIDIPDTDEAEIAVRDLVCKTIEAIPPKWGIKRIPFKADAKSGHEWGRLKESELKAANNNEQEKVA